MDKLIRLVASRAGSLVDISKISPKYAKQRASYLDSPDKILIANTPPGESWRDFVWDGHDF